MDPCIIKKSYKNDQQDATV